MKERLHIVREDEMKTQNRLVSRFQFLTSKRIDLERIKRGIYPEWHQLTTQFKGNLDEAISLTNHSLFNTWLQAQEYGDEDAKSSIQKERLHLMDFFAQPLDDR